MAIDLCVRLGRRIRYLRSDRRITQIMLADMIGLGRANLSRIENGRVSTDIRTLAAISKALGVPLKDLLDL